MIASNAEPIVSDLLAVCHDLWPHSKHRIDVYRRIEISDHLYGYLTAFRPVKTSLEAAWTFRQNRGGIVSIKPNSSSWPNKLMVSIIKS